MKKPMLYATFIVAALITGLAVANAQPYPSGTTAPDQATPMASMTPSPGPT